MKSPTLAFVLSALCAGMGLIYLDHWRLGLLNLAVVLAAGALAAQLPGGPLGRYAATMLLNVFSGALAYHMARRRNRRVAAARLASRGVV